MKILITSDINPSESADLTVVRTFDEFRKVLTPELEEIMITTFLLGLACLYWMIDNTLDLLKKTNFVLNIPSVRENEVLKQMLVRAARKETT